MAVSKLEAMNIKALSAAQKRSEQDNKLIQHIDEQLANHHYAVTDQDKLKTLKSDLQKAKVATDKEIKAREELQQAYNQSTYQNKNADPSIKEKQRALNKVRKENKPVMHGGKNLVNGVCQPCLNKEIDSIIDCDTPYYAKYGTSGGPQYKQCHNHTLASYSGWDDLISSNIKTSSEKNVLVAMSANEGDMDAVQAYDSEIITVGAMQKTVNPSGAGELPRQLAQLRDDPATKAVFDREIGSKGYSINKEIIGKHRDGTPKYGVHDFLYFKDPKDPDSKPITGASLDSLIQSHRERWKDTLEPFRLLGRTPEFQKKQVLDFNDRLIQALDKKPKGYQSSIGDYITSEYGSALVLDQDVNRPGYVREDFGKSLDAFFNDNPNVSKDPTSWSTDDRVAYEKSILENYVTERRGTDMMDRAANLAKKNLSTNPNSLKFPGE